MINPMDLTGSTVLVTGASSGIGRETAIFLSSLGASLILVARDQARLDATHAALAPGRHFVFPFDLEQHEQTVGWMASVAETTGPIRSLVHCAGIAMTKAIRFMEVEEMQKILSVNLLSALVLAKAFRSRQVRAQPSASLVFVSSTAASVGYPGWAAYSASKAGLEGLTRSLAHELSREKIRVNAVCPGWVSTQMTDGVSSVLSEEQLAAIRNSYMLWPGTPLDVACAIAYLVAETGRWVTGTTMMVDGGSSVRGGSQ
ncbi:MAG: SDR family oxidoreductase [Chthoniobacter sp.]